MVQQNNRIAESGNSKMSGQFLVQDYISSTKGVENRKCDVQLSYDDNNTARLVLRNVDPALRPAEVTMLIKANDWIIQQPNISANTYSLVMAKASRPNEFVLLEAKKESVSVLKAMEAKLREYLKVICYRIKVRQTNSKDPLLADLHILRDRLIILMGRGPHLRKILDYPFTKSGDGITLKSNKELLVFDEVDNYFVILGDQNKEIWQTIQGCLKATRIGGGKSKIVNNLRLQFENKQTESSDLLEKKNSSKFIDMTTCRSSKENDNASSLSPNPKNVYFNLPMRPCKYIYMNLPEERKTPRLNHSYINVFHLGSVYQNWRSFTKTKEDKMEQQNHSQYSDLPHSPPPRPPRLTAPPLPPKPKTKNKPPTSPLPPPPRPSGTDETPPPLFPRVVDQPPSLPLPRLPESSSTKEIQYVIFSSKPMVGQILVIQVVLFQKNDFRTLERIKKLEEEANYQVLKSLPDSISVSNDLKISLVDIDQCCTLKSDQEQIIEHEIVKEGILQSCWLIIEFHLEHESSSRRNFHGKIRMEPCTNSHSRSSRSSKETQISITFQDATQNGPYSPTRIACNPLTCIGVKKYLEVCSLMDIPCALNNNWTGLAGEVGLTIEEVFKIQSRACFSNYSPTNEVITIWSQRQGKSCNLEQFKEKLRILQRFDVLDMLHQQDS